MSRFWIEVYNELAKDALLELAFHIERGLPLLVALNAALADLEHTKNHLIDIQKSYRMDDAIIDRVFNRGGN